MKIQLLENERNVLERWECSETSRLAKRALIIRLLAAGESTKSIAKIYGINEQRIFELYEKFNSDGLIGLLEESRSGRPSKINQKISAMLFKMLEQERQEIYEVQVIANKLGVSKDRLWSKARLTGQSYVRRSLKRVSTYVPSDFSQRLVGLVVSQGLFLVVKNLSSKKSYAIDYPGIWDKPNRDCVNQYLEKVAPNPMDLFSAVQLFEKSLLENEKELMSQSRVLREQALRWIFFIKEIVNSSKDNFSILVLGNYASENLLQWLKLIKSNFEINRCSRIQLFCVSDLKSLNKEIFSIQSNRSRTFISNVQSLMNKKIYPFVWYGKISD